MELPQAPGSGQGADAAGACVTLVHLTKRSEFTRAAAARRQSAASFLLQARPRGAAEPAGESIALIRVGYTCSRTVGTAVARNRAKRRLRAAARAVLPGAGLPGWDYVLVGRPAATAARPFALLVADLTTALAQIHTRP